MNWEKKDIPPEQVKELAAKYGCDHLTASILLRRGLSSGEDIRYFLEEDPRYLRSPFELPGMEDAVERVLAAKEEEEKVLVFGDRDTDGITSTAMVVNFLTGLGMDVSWKLPSGDDRYGLSMEAIEEFAAAYGTLIITVDCGISNTAEIRRANELSVDVIITDHHNPQEEIPEALAIVNPKLPGSPFPYLSGCGVAYKLVSALRFALKSELYNQPMCLLNTRPVNDAWIIEIAKMRNLVVRQTLIETVVPGMVSISNTRLPAFLESQQILAWDAPQQKRTLAKIFGKGVEIGMLDVAPDIGKMIPSAKDISLLRIKELSRIARYSEKESGELEVFINLFTTFVQRRENHFTDEDAADLQFACLGTIADIMPLKDENRIIVRRGLQSLIEKPRPGLSELLFKLGMSGRRLNAQDVSWLLCPAINAAGRMGSPEKGAALFLEKDPSVRDRLAADLVSMNEDRKKMGEESWALVEPRARENLENFDSKLAFAFGEDLPRGVTGIMANRLVGQFKVPALVVSFGKDGLATGSLRSPGNYDLRFLLEPCEDLFLDWGGHDYAAGFSMETGEAMANWNSFLERLKNIALNMEFGDSKNESAITVDAELPLNYLNADILKTVDRFEPYGEENRPLNFLAKGLRVSDLHFMGKPEAKHVKLTLDAGKYKWPAKYWNAADKVKREFDTGDTVDLIFSVSRNFFKGIETPEMTVTDLKRSETKN
ncbi:single-stranded-DNA-specific exonuclease RecJ [Leadbettera azotonutricia]|uniref:Single-stranded-DNA-specific exonuclease RecJ n=1 Tax=Leadbettera azotonutricia (strain ATCC BAA-888 / DSM 13862 / ZAS-9) TaxID=545695 RepID=F5Y6Q8_LEAAZ|nr:single-stranded-DNA-specific exonuclease RecJ [Leadbettera azotonutricia]AEF80700.1 single-stranded-DNA-specific exonuclease RecJ [Leadbettera azotonutricia ZAS-9]